MKRYGWLATVTAAVMILIWLLSRTLREEPAAVHVTSVQLQQVEQRVSCSGRVEQAGGEVLAAAAAGTKIQVRVAVPESRLRRVAVGQRVKVSGAAFSADSYAGRVVALAGTAYTTASGNTVVDAFIVLDGTDESLRCGLTAKADICVATARGILLPYSCLLADEQGREYVYLAEKGKAVKRYVTIAEETVEGALVTGGIEDGEQLITDPTEALKEGDRIREVTP